MIITKIEKKIMQISSVKAKGGKSRKSEKEGKGFRVFDFITFGLIKFELAVFTMSLVVFGVIEEGVAGTQKYGLEESKRIEGYMSRNEANRVKIEGDRIVEVIGLGEEFGLESDERLGQIFVKLLDVNSNKNAVFTVVTEKGKTQDISLKLKKGEGEFILISQLDSEKASEKLIGSKHIRHNEIVNMIKYVRGAPLKDKGQGYLSKGGLEIEFEGDKVVGKYRVEVWKLCNKGKSQKILHEKQFTGDGVAAIMLESRTLREGDETKLYKVIYSR
jgi:hypothetical protein